MTNTRQQFLKACEEGDIDDIKDILASRDGDVELTADDIGMAVCESCRQGNIELFDVVVSGRSYIDLRSVFRHTDDRGRRALHYATESGSLEIVKRLVSEGVPINCKDSNNVYPIHLAVQAKHADVVKFLLVKGANCKSTNKRCENSLHCAAIVGDSNVARIIVEHSPHCLNTSTPTKFDANSALHVAVKHGNTSVVEYLCSAGATVDIKNAQNATPLHIAAACGEAQSAQVLLTYGAGIDAKDKDNKEPLHAAMYGKHFDVIKTLVASGANVNAHDGHGMAPLHIAAIAMECPEIMEFIIQNGGDVNLRSTARQETPILVAASMGDIEGIRVLMKHGCDVAICDNNGTSVLHKAICIPLRNWAKNADATIDILIRSGADLDVVDCHGFTPLHACAFQTNMHAFRIRTLKLLVSAGAYLGLPVSDGESFSETASSGARRNSPLCWFVFHGEEAAAKYLAKAGWDLGQETWLRLTGESALQTRLHGQLLDFAHRPRSLAVYCRNTIRAQLRTASGHREIFSRIDRLNLPSILKKDLKLENIDDTEL